MCVGQMANSVPSNGIRRNRNPVTTNLRWPPVYGENRISGLAHEYRPRTLLQQGIDRLIECSVFQRAPLLRYAVVDSIDRGFFSSRRHASEPSPEASIRTVLWWQGQS